MSEPAPRNLIHNALVHRGLLVLIAFTAGAAVMIIELAAIRVLAPWFGNSLYTWTGLIGVILTAMSAGYYAGGWLADKKTSYLLLAHILALAAVFILAIPLLSHVLGTPLAKYNVMLGPVLASLFMFALPGFCLGMVPPYIIRLISLLSADRHIGLSAGTVYMVSTIGSVLGTFASGFWLIPSLDLEQVFWFTALAIALLSGLGYVLSFRDRGRLAAQSLALICAIPALMAAATFTKPPPDGRVIFDGMSFYHRIRVLQKNLPSGAKVTELFLDTTQEGAQIEGSPQNLIPYQQYWELVRLLPMKPEAALFLGGGAFTMPQSFFNTYPQSRVEVVEIDPAVVEVGRRFFQLDRYPQLHIVVDDARRYLSRTQTKYHLIFGDAYNGLRSVPAHLLTREFFQSIKNRLAEGGIFMINIISAVKGRDSALFMSVMKTISQVFPETQVFAIVPQKLAQLQSIIIVAANSDLRLDSVLSEIPPDKNHLRKLLHTRISPQQYTTRNGHVLTDSFNPVEYLVAQTIQKGQ